MGEGGPSSGPGLSSGPGPSEWYGPSGRSGPSSTAITPSIVNGPETRTVPLTISGLSTNSSEVALAAMHSLTSSIFARHAAR